ncbi:MAG: hypothetical protein AAF490_22765 [Chloroflexota bacterium]
MKELTQTIANLDAWFESIRTPEGYGGPVVHWWQNCLQFTGAGLDWRYEGMIIGYLNLWQKTRETAWLEKATRCGMSLVKGQEKSGNYRHSSFELNPYGGGTPHEAAADIGLLQLALGLKSINDKRWKLFTRVAERNLRKYYMTRLWDKKQNRFRDSLNYDSFVPNKACTLVEAIFALADILGKEDPIEKYALPTLEAVIQLQQTSKGSVAGGIAQSQQNGKLVEAYFPYYVARCVPALLRAYDYTNEEKWLASAKFAFDFVNRVQTEEGLLPQVVYPTNENVYPTWIAPLGDVLRVGELLAEQGIRVDLSAMQKQMFEGQLPTGGIVTGRGFGGQISQRNPALQDFRDCIPVAGWSDKAFRFLTGCLPYKSEIPRPETSAWTARCTVRGKTAVWRETQQEMKLTVGQNVLYQWQKGQPWAKVSKPEVLWK